MLESCAFDVLLELVVGAKIPLDILIVRMFLRGVEGIRGTLQYY